MPRDAAGAKASGNHIGREGTMRKQCLLLCFSAVLFVPLALAEEFSLKDGTKISGKMVKIQRDTIEVETLYGKIKISRSDLLSINFPENQPEAASQEKLPTGLVPVEHSLQGGNYTNTTGKFRLTVPPEWRINEAARANVPGALTMLTTRDDNAFVLVVKEPFVGSIEAYKKMAETVLDLQLKGYRKLDEGNVTIAGEEGFFIEFTANPEGMPLQIREGMVPDEGGMVRIRVVTPLPLFSEMRETLEKIMLSYETIEE